jgi:HSP90 family molecular chaperone
MVKALADRAADVRLTDRLTTSPACLVADRHGMSTHLERLLKSAGQKVPAGKPVLEINRRTRSFSVSKANPMRAGSQTGAICSSIRRCSRKAARWTIPPRS